MVREAQAAGRTSESRQVRRLVARAQQGERAALEELYLIYFDRIYGYLHVTVGNRHDAEDLTTQTFLRMLELIEGLSSEQQQVLALKFVFNFANAEVGTILGKTEGAIKSLQHRALVSLQRQIEECEAAT